MKTLHTLLSTLLLSSVALLSCEDDGPKMQIVDFEADFYTQLVSFAENADCTAPKNFKNTQQGEGTATMIGDFTTTLTFCVNPANFMYDNVQGSFASENDEEIFITGSGQIVPTEKEGYDLEFMDQFEITGGTGRFKGAKGNLVSESYVNLTTGVTDHVWTGEITIIK